jgi:hypothetical protein
MPRDTSGEYPDRQNAFEKEGEIQMTRKRIEAFSVDVQSTPSRAVKNTLACIVILGCLSFVSCSNPGSTGGGDTPAFVPEITGLSLDVTSINVGTSQQATMTISVTPGTTVTSVDYEATSLNGNIRNAGFWVYNVPVTNNQFTISPNKYLPDGTWGISQLNVKTSMYIYSYSGGDSGTTYTIVVTDLTGTPVQGLKNGSTTIVTKELATTGGTPDTTFPRITSVSVAPSAHTFLPGDTVTLTVGVSDTESGIGIVKSANLSPAYMGSPSQNVQFTMVAPNTLQGNLVLSSSMDAYPCNLNFDVSIGDAAGNITHLSLDPTFAPLYIDSSGQATIPASAGTVPFAYTPLYARTPANGAGWAPDSSLAGYHTVTTVSNSSTIDVYNIPGGTLALHFQADTATPSVPADSSTLSSIYTAKWPYFTFFWEDGSVATGGLEPASSPAALTSVLNGYYNPGLRITPVGSHTKLYVFTLGGGTLSERVF